MPSTKANAGFLALASLVVGFAVGLLVASATMTPIERKVDDASSRARTLPWLILVNVVGWVIFLGVTLFA